MAGTRTHRFGGARTEGRREQPQLMGVLQVPIIAIAICYCDCGGGRKNQNQHPPPPQKLLTRPCQCVINGMPLTFQQSCCCSTSLASSIIHCDNSEVTVLESWYWRLCGSCRQMSSFRRISFKLLDARVGLELSIKSGTAD